mgnify:CR=1 FL=1
MEATVDGFSDAIRASVADSGSLDCALPFLEGRLDREGDYRMRVRTVSGTPLELQRVSGR